MIKKGATDAPFLILDYNRSMSDIKLKRKAEEYLDKWLFDKHRKPLIIYGARQIGKTYLIDTLFKESHFKDKKYILVDFRFDGESRRYIKNHIDSDEIIEYLSLKKNINIDSNTLLFFDEVQECLPLLTALKSFCEKHIDIPVIVTGSLVRTKIKQMDLSKKIIYDPEILPEYQDGHNNYMFPLGKINEYNLFPLTFNEFLYSVNKNFFNYLEKSWKDNKVLDDEYHNMALSYVKDYLIVGSLPENIKIFIETNSYEESRTNLITLYNNYLNDMVLYQISDSTILRARSVFNSIYSQLNKENKNFKISLIEKNKKYRDYEYSLFWLVTANLVYPSYQVKENVSLPLSKNEDSLFRLYMPDVGLLMYQSGISISSFIDDINKSNNSGLFYENYVANEIISRNGDLFYWKGKTSSELEFLISKDGTIIPIDVKKNKGKLNSLIKFRENNKKGIAVKVSSNKYGYDLDNMLYTLPHYYVGFFFDEYIGR